MIFVVEAIGSRAEAFSPARYSPLLASVSTHARAETSCAWATSVAHPSKRTSATASFGMFEGLITGP